MKNSFSKRKQDKKNQIEILELDNTITKINSVDEISSRMRGTEERNSEVDDKIIEST